MKCEDNILKLDNVSHRQWTKQKSRWKRDIHARNESYYLQNTCLNLDSCWKLQRYCIQDSYRTIQSFSEEELRGKWCEVQKIDILKLDNVSHRQLSKQKSRWKRDIHARNESYYQQNTCLNLDSCWKLERYCIQDNYRTKHSFSD